MSLTFFNRAFLGGEIIFLRTGMHSRSLQSYYMLAYDDQEDHVTNLAMEMSDHWRMSSPKLLVSVISDVKHFSRWRQRENVDDFEEGLMKAACLTEMWILTDGMNCGMSTIIGNAVTKELTRRKFNESEQNLVRFLIAETLPEITVIGIVSRKTLGENTKAALINGIGCPDPIKIVPNMTEGDDLASQLNPSITHFIILDDENAPGASIYLFIAQVEQRLSQPIRQDTGNVGGSPGKRKEIISASIPLVGLLTNGGPPEISRVLGLLKKQVPVIIISGDGSAADLLSFAITAASDSSHTDSNDSYLKTELLRRTNEVFHDEFKEDTLSRNTCRDNILECVSLAVQGGCCFVTLIKRSDPSSELRNLNKVILKAILQSQRKETNIEQLSLDLQLSIDWKYPELAEQDIFQKYNLTASIVSEEQFGQVLLRPEREEFVELFLDRGFLLYNYLSHRRLAILFDQCPDKNFFIGICLEGVLGTTYNDDWFTEHFRGGQKENQLNTLLRILTDLEHLVIPLILTLNSSTTVESEKMAAEQYALHALVFWAALTNRGKLVKMLWSRSSQPMPLALVLSTLYHRLSKFCDRDDDLQYQLLTTGVQFGRLAVQLLDFCYHESVGQALLSLTIKLPEFTGLTAMELAVIGKNKFFIAHPCCQQYVFNLWYGPIRIRRRSIFSTSDFPNDFKVILCLFLVFPTIAWIDLPKKTRKKIGTSTKEQNINRKDSINTFVKQASLPTKMYFLWTAPIGKFWTSQIFFLLFLCLFIYTSTLPICGEVLFNLASCLLLLAYAIDQLYLFVVKKWHRRSGQLGATLRPLVIYLWTALWIMLFQISEYRLLSQETFKFILGLSLFYMCNRAMISIFPVSKTLGPLLVNITVMMRRDLITWLRIWMLVMVSGAVTIQAVLYPAAPFGETVLYDGLLRGVMGLFTVDTEILYERESECDRHYEPVEGYGCHALFEEEVESCRYSDMYGLLIYLQYIFITKLIFGTLIFAICSVTMSNTYAKAIEIWKFKFAILVNDYVYRPCLPVPLVVLAYPFIIGNCCFHMVQHYYKSRCPCCQGDKKRKVQGTFHAWRAYIQMQKKEEKREHDELESLDRSNERLKSLTQEVSEGRKQIQSLNNRLISALKSQTSVLLLLEKLGHTGHDKTDEGLQKLRPIHNNCRNSVYPGTNIQRCVVFEKDVKWEETCVTYDPAIYCKPLEEYPSGVLLYIDPDIFELQLMEEERKMETDKPDNDDLVNMVIPEFSPVYNNVMEVVTTTGETYTVDRTTWHDMDSEENEYILDDSGVPRNIMGRTGMRGRGNLWRWGPNHMMHAIITRWSSIYNSAGGVEGFLTLDGKGVLEVIAVYDELLQENVLPGGFVSGSSSKYSLMCEVFLGDVLKDGNVQGSKTLDMDDMTQFFKAFAINEYSLLGFIAKFAESNFEAKQVYRGYIDHRNNTDNAWVESEIWHFHYKKDVFDKRIPEREKHWYQISAQMSLSSGYLPYVLEVATQLDDG